MCGSVSVCVQMGVGQCQKENCRILGHKRYTDHGAGGRIGLPTNNANLDRMDTRMDLVEHARTTPKRDSQIPYKEIQ